MSSPRKGEGKSLAATCLVRTAVTGDMVIEIGRAATQERAERLLRIFQEMKASTATFQNLCPRPLRRPDGRIELELDRPRWGLARRKGHLYMDDGEWSRMELHWREALLWLHEQKRIRIQDVAGGVNLVKVLETDAAQLTKHDGPQQRVTEIERASRLPDPQMEVLIALDELKATSEDELKTAAEIAKKSHGEADIYKVKKPLAKLTAQGYVQSVLGRSGGSWITKEGRQRLREEKKRRKG